MRQPRATRVDEFRGTDINTPPELLPGERFPIDDNGDRRPDRSWRPRRGYSRLLDTDDNGMQFQHAADENVVRRLIQFERDDNTLFTVGAGGFSQWQFGLVDEVQAFEAGEYES
jgi:hypothetical protein